MKLFGQHLDILLRRSLAGWLWLLRSGNSSSEETNYEQNVRQEFHDSPLCGLTFVRCANETLRCGWEE